MCKVLGLLLLATLALGNTQHEPFEGLIDCLITYIPKVLQDAQKVYLDIQNQNYDALLVDAQALANDGQAALNCARTQAQSFLKHESDKQIVKDIAKCISEEANQFQVYYERLQNDWALGNYISLIGDVQYMLEAVSGILECFTGQTSESRPTVESLLNEKDNLACLTKFLPTILADAGNLLNDFQKSDLNSILPHAESLIADTQAFIVCLKAN
jgi:hypothetical protein